MELGYDPLWDEQGRLRQGCTVGEALAWMTKFGGRTPGGNPCASTVWATRSAVCSMDRNGPPWRTSPSPGFTTATIAS